MYIIVTYMLTSSSRIKLKSLLVNSTVVKLIVSYSAVQKSYNSHSHKFKANSKLVEMKLT